MFVKLVKRQSLGLLIDPPPRFSSERKIPAPIQYNQVIPIDHLTDQDPPPVQTDFSPLGRLTIKVTRNEGPPTSLSETFLKKEDLGLKGLERIVGREVAGVQQTNPASVFRKSLMLKSGLQTRIPALLDASCYQAEFSDYLCSSRMCNISALLSLAVCIRRFWASFPLSRLSCRNFNFCLSSSGAPP